MLNLFSDRNSIIPVSNGKDASKLQILDELPIQIRRNSMRVITLGEFQMSCRSALREF